MNANQYTLDKPISVRDSLFEQRERNVPLDLPSQTQVLQQKVEGNFPGVSGVISSSRPNRGSVDDLHANAPKDPMSQRDAAPTYVSKVGQSSLQ